MNFCLTKHMYFFFFYGIKIFEYPMTSLLVQGHLLYFSKANTFLHILHMQKQPHGQSTIDLRLFLHATHKSVDKY